MSKKQRDSPVRGGAGGTSSCLRSAWRVWVVVWHHVDHEEMGEEQPAVQQRRLQLYPQRPGRHRHAARRFAVRPAAHPRGGEWVLHSGCSGARVREYWKRKFIQSELSRAQRCRFDGSSEGWSMSISCLKTVFLRTLFWDLY